MTSPTRPRAAHLSGLDGLRAIAVAAVILYHLSPGALPGGFLGVDIFFVISGFLITGLLLRERTATGRIRLGAFWARRARRLLPALVVLVLVCGSAALLLGGDVLVHLGRQILGAATFSSNWIAIGTGQSYFDDATPDLFRNLWSLAVEEQFYLVWPFAVLLLALIRWRTVRVIIVSVLALLSAAAMVLLYIPGGDATRVYYGTDTHAFGLAIGAALALAMRARAGSRRRRLTVLGVVALVAVLATTALLQDDSPLTYQGGLVGVALLTAVVIAASVGSRLGRVLDVAPLRWVGARSYGLYLWHWPVFVLVEAALPTWDRTGAGGWELCGIALAITVVAATLSYRLIEQPVRRDGFGATWRRWTRAWTSGPARAVGAAAAAILLVAGLVGTTGAVLRDPGVGSAQADIEAGARAITTAPGTAPASASAAPTPDPSGTPVPAAPPSLPGGDQVSAIGDSVMLASAPELESAFPGIDINAVVSRQASAAPGIVQGMIDAGTLRQTLLLGLGTNGPVDPGILEKLHSMVGPRHQIVVVNVQAPRGWVDGVNSELSHFAQEYRNVELANWKDAISGKLTLLSRDQIHPGQSGGLVYVQAVTEALQRLAELPPTLGPNDYGLAPVPL